MFNQKDVYSQDQIQEAIHKATVIQELVQSAGWKYIMEIVNTLLDRESRALATQKMDETYYKKIGFLQEIVYFKALPTLIKDEKVPNFLIHQGRLLGLQTTQNLPQYFFEGRQQANTLIQSMTGKD